MEDTGLVKPEQPVKMPDREIKGRQDDERVGGERSKDRGNLAILSRLFEEKPLFALYSLTPSVSAARNPLANLLRRGQRPRAFFNKINDGGEERNSSKC